LAKKIDRAQPSLKIMDIAVARNAFGRQIDSFQIDLEVPVLDQFNPAPFPGVFIRAPRLVAVQGAAQLLACLPDGTGVAAREGPWLVSAFHPELTGRENIFLNGAILGMGRREIKNKFDEIIAFAEVEKFLDTPVKRYSSGMYVRLAFAVAAHLEPELLLVDEVLAVGDINFQKKCLGKMEDAANNGRTILFVSHNMGAIQSLCNKAVLLKKGSIKKEGGVQEVVQSYLNENDVLSCQKWSFEKQGSLIKNDFIEPQSLSLLDTEGQILPSHIERTRPVFVELVFNLKQLRRDLTLGIAVYNSKGDYLFHSLQTDGNEKLWPELEKGINRLRMKLPVDILNEGEYRLVLIGALHKTQWLYNPDQSDVMVNFTIAGGLSESPYWLHGRRGMFAPCLTWTKVKG